MKWLVISAILVIVPTIYSENIFKLDITPEEAQKYISSQSLDLNYAPKLGENPVPTTKDVDGDFIYQGRKLPNPGDYVEEHYLANQFHGQDGLGRALFGYSDWNQGRVEALNADGDVRGAYKYVDPRGKDFIANYWADHSGFHQEDNRPKIVLEPVTDTPAVQKAREEHFRLWNELAQAAKANPDSNSDVYNSNANRYDEAQSQIDQANEVISGQETENKYNHAEPREWKYVPTEEEATGVPHGFFYKFDYEVPLLRNIQEREELAKARNARSADEPVKEEEKKDVSKSDEPKNDESKSGDSVDVPSEVPEITPLRHLPNTK